MSTDVIVPRRDPIDVFLSSHVINEQIKIKVKKKNFY